MLLATGAGRDSGLITAFAARGPKKFIRPSPKHTKRGIKKLEDAQDWESATDVCGIQGKDHTRDHRRRQNDEASTFSTEFAFLNNTDAWQQQGHAGNSGGSNTSRIHAPGVANNTDPSRTTPQHIPGRVPAAPRPPAGTRVPDEQLQSGHLPTEVILTAAEKRKRIGAARSAVYGRSWRQLDVRLYLLKRSQMAATLSALREAAAQDPGVEAAVKAVLGIGHRSVMAHGASESHDDADSWDEETGGAVIGAELEGGGGEQRGGSRVHTPHVRLPRQRGGGEVDDALPSPQTYYKLPVRWRARILVERVAALRRELHTLAPGMAAAMLASAPVLLVLTSSQVVRRLQDLARALRCTVNDAALAVAQQPVLGLMSVQQVEGRCASLLSALDLGAPAAAAAATGGGGQQQMRLHYVVRAAAAMPSVLLGLDTTRILTRCDLLASLLGVTQRQAALLSLCAPHLLVASGSTLRTGLTLLQGMDLQPGLWGHIHQQHQQAAGNQQGARPSSALACVLLQPSLLALQPRLLPKAAHLLSQVLGVTKQEALLMFVTGCGCHLNTVPAAAAAADAVHDDGQGPAPNHRLHPAEAGLLMLNNTQHLPRLMSLLRRVTRSSNQGAGTAGGGEGLICMAPGLLAAGPAALRRTCAALKVLVQQDVAASLVSSEECVGQGHGVKASLGAAASSHAARQQQEAAAAAVADTVVAELIVRWPTLVAGLALDAAVEYTPCPGQAAGAGAGAGGNNRWQGQLRASSGGVSVTSHLQALVSRTLGQSGTWLSGATSQHHVQNGLKGVQRVGTQQAMTATSPAGEAQAASAGASLWPTLRRLALTCSGPLGKAKFMKQVLREPQWLHSKLGQLPVPLTSLRVLHDYSSRGSHDSSSRGEPGAPRAPQGQGPPPLTRRQALLVAARQALEEVCRPLCNVLQDIAAQQLGGPLGHSQEAAWGIVWRVCTAAPYLLDPGTTPRPDEVAHIAIQQGVLPMRKKAPRSLKTALTRKGTSPSQKERVHQKQRASL